MPRKMRGVERRAVCIVSRRARERGGWSIVAVFWDEVSVVKSGL